MKYSKINTDSEQLDKELKKIEKKLGIELYVALEMDEKGIYPVLKYYKK